MRWLDGINSSVQMSLSILWDIVKDREARRATVHGVTKSQTRLKRLSSSSNSTNTKHLRAGSSGSLRHFWLFNLQPNLHIQREVGVPSLSHPQRISVRQLRFIFQLTEMHASQGWGVGLFCSLLIFPASGFFFQ